MFGVRTWPKLHVLDERDESTWVQPNGDVARLTHGRITPPPPLRSTAYATCCDCPARKCEECPVREAARREHEQKFGPLPTDNPSRQRPRWRRLWGGANHEQEDQPAGRAS